MGNCQSHTETTTVQPGSRTQGPVKHKGDCLSRRTKGCVSLWGIPISPLTACVYCRFVWLEKVMWEGEKEETERWKKRKKKHLWEVMHVCMKWERAYVLMCVKCGIGCWCFRGIWGPCSVSLSLVQRLGLNTHKHRDNRHPEKFK